MTTTSVYMYAKGLFVCLCQCMSLCVSGCVLCVSAHLSAHGWCPQDSLKPEASWDAHPVPLHLPTLVSLPKRGVRPSPDHPQTIFLSISCCDGYKCCSNFSSFPEIYKMVCSVTLSALLLSFLFCHVVAKQREE